MATEITKKENQQNLVTRLVSDKIIPHGICCEAYEVFPKEYLLINKEGNVGYAAPLKGVLVNCMFHKLERDEQGNYNFYCRWSEERSAKHTYDKDLKFVGANFT